MLIFIIILSVILVFAVALLGKFHSRKFDIVVYTALILNCIAGLTVKCVSVSNDIELTGRHMNLVYQLEQQYGKQPHDVDIIVFEYCENDTTDSALEKRTSFLADISEINYRITRARKNMDNIFIADLACRDLAELPYISLRPGAGKTEKECKPLKQQYTQIKADKQIIDNIQGLHTDQ